VSFPGIDNLRNGEELEAALRRIGDEHYHNRHPFHRLLHSGRLDRGQVQAWALNRYYYQSRIPMKDSALMARIVDPDLRREWSQRVVDHDGTREGQGGVQRWLKLCVAVGLDEDMVKREEGILPATRFAVDAYVRFVWEKSLIEAIASSLTELFAPGIIRERVSGMLANYDFIDEETLAYFKPRLNQAPRDADFALDYVKREARTPEERRKVCEALLFKCDVLWSQLDGLNHAYVLGGGVPPGCFVPAEDAVARVERQRSPGTVPPLWCGLPGRGSGIAESATSGCCWFRSGSCFRARPRPTSCSGWSALARLARSRKSLPPNTTRRRM